MVYDLIVLGGGPAGYLGAERAAQAGMKVLLLEERQVGGVCLNEGCIPTKTILHSAKLFHYVDGGAAEYGVQSKGAALDFPAVMKRKEKVVKTLVSGVSATLKKLKVDVVNARGVIERREADGSYRVTAGGAPYHGKKLLICTGSHPFLPGIPGLQEGLAEGKVLTSREILELKELPGTLTVIGGGVIGLEIAFAMASFGVTVTVVEMLDRVGGPLDAEIAKLLQRNCEKAGIQFVLGAKVTGIHGATVSYEKGGAAGQVTGDKVLFCIGRRASTEGIGLENIGVELQRGAIVTDEQMKTNIPGVFAAGDVNGKSMLAHVAYREAEVAVQVMQGIEDRMCYTAIPSVLYTQPEVASVGYTRQAAEAAGFQVREVTIPMVYSGRYVAENEHGDGIAKAVVEQGGNRLLGIHLIGTPASEIITAASVALGKEISVNGLKSVVFPHPTVGEILRELLFAL